VYETQVHTDDVPRKTRSVLAWAFGCGLWVAAATYSGYWLVRADQSLYASLHGAAPSFSLGIPWPLGGSGPLLESILTLLVLGAIFGVLSLFALLAWYGRPPVPVYAYLLMTPLGILWALVVGLGCRWFFYPGDAYGTAKIGAYEFLLGLGALAFLFLRPPKMVGPRD
jgi:hypothetical protein